MKPTGTLRTTRGNASKRAPAKPKRWLHGLCECCDDPVLACTVCVCQCTTAGQVYQRATGTGCLCISILMWTLFAGTQVLNSASMTLREEYEHVWWTDRYEAQANVLSSVSGLLGVATAVAGTYFLCTARRIVRQRDEIPEGRCGSWEDCCVSYWCGFCSMVQLLRQDSITRNEYRACSATAV